MTTTSTPPPAPQPPSVMSLAATCALAWLSALWAVVLWAELRVLRAGAAPFCAMGGASDCARVWDAPFASAIHRLTGVPVAGWGVVWGLAAAAVALLALARHAQGRPSLLLLTSLRLLAGAGMAAVLVLMTAVALQRTFCGGCAVTYLLVAGFAGIALFGWPRVGWAEAPRAGWVALGSVAAGWLLVLYPGLQTPRTTSEESREALARVAAPATGTGDRRLTEMIGGLSMPMRQALADSIAIYRAAKPLPEPSPRAYATGPATAPVRITEFTDIRCSHCADLQRTIGELQSYLGADSFSVVARQFPLDRGCNPNIQGEARDPVRCLAARARLCAEGQPGAHAYANALFAVQEKLTEADVKRLAAEHVPGVKLDACVASPDTERKLQEDITLALEHELEGTPLVLVNGRRGTSFGPFLYAMIVTGGSPDDPAFRDLPPPNPQAHIH